MLAPTPYFADRGCHVRIYEEARVLTALGHDVRIATYHIGRDMPGIPTFRTLAIPWYRKLTAGPSWHKPYLDILLFFKALALARTFRPHLIHAHLHEGAFIGLFLKMVLRIPLLFDCQGSLTAEIMDHGFIRQGSLLHSLFSSLERFINDRADCIITSSGAAAEDLCANWGVPPGKVLGLMDGVNSQEFRPVPRDEARTALHIPGDRFLVVYLGLLNSYQGVDLLLEAVSLLKVRGSSLHFLIMGFPEDACRQKSVEMGIADRITFTGRIDYAEAPLYLSTGDLAVSPKVSLAEANGKLFNYMACGLPTVVFDTPINREILGDTGVYVRYGDAVDLAAQLEALGRDEPRRARLSVAARQRSVEMHSWEERGARLQEVYSRLMSLSASRSQVVT
jgi:glycosyltransferase involved in cell wall biosynthesis